MANHLQIHIFEPSADRSRAVAAAKRLDAMNFAPEDEHLAHMTAHTWVDIGSYRLAVAASNRALALFDQYLATPGIDPAHASYIRHDTVVGFGAAMMLGNYAQAAALAERLDTSARTFRAPANYKMIAAVRFGRWADVAEATPKTPADPLHIPLAYGKLARGDVAGAKAELAGIDTNAGTAFTQALRAALLAQHGDRKGADAAFAVALAAEKEHNTGENLPTVPVGEIMGYTYYRLHDYAVAESAFRDTLARYPNNPRALYGLAESLNKLGKTAQAQAAAKDFSAAWRGSDSTLTTDNL